MPFWFVVAMVSMILQLGILLILIHGVGSNNYGLNVEAIQVIPVAHDDIHDADDKFEFKTSNFSL